MLQPAIERSTTFRLEVSIHVRPAGPPAMSVPPLTTAPLAPCVGPAFDADLAKRAVRSIVGAPFEPLVITARSPVAVLTGYTRLPSGLMASDHCISAGSSA